MPGLSRRPALALAATVPAVRDAHTPGADLWRLPETPARIRSYLCRAGLRFSARPADPTPEIPWPSRHRAGAARVPGTGRWSHADTGPHDHHAPACEAYPGTRLQPRNRN